MNEAAVDVLVHAADQLHGVLTALELGQPVDQALLQACALNLFTIVNVLAGVRNGGELEQLQRYGPQLAEEESADQYLRAAVSELPPGRAHVVLLGSRTGRAPYAVANIPPLELLELLERFAVKVTAQQFVARRIEEDA